MYQDTTLYNLCQESFPIMPAWSIAMLPSLAIGWLNQLDVAFVNGAAAVIKIAKASPVLGECDLALTVLILDYGWSRDHRVIDPITLVLVGNCHNAAVGGDVDVVQLAGAH